MFRILTEEVATPLWITILVSLASGLIATIVTLIVQFCLDKKKTKKDLFLNLVALRDCTFKNTSFQNSINRVQIVFYKDKDVISKYKIFIKSINDNVYSPNQKIITDEFIAMLESMADVVGYKNFDWQSIKERFTTDDLFNGDIEQSSTTTKNTSTGVKKPRSNNRNDAPPEGKGDK